MHCNKKAIHISEISKEDFPFCGGVYFNQLCTIENNKEKKILSFVKCTIKHV